MALHPSRSLVFAVALALVAPAFAQSSPCFEPNLGTDLLLSDDSVSAPQPLGFVFAFAGGSVTSIRVSSNGFVWLDNSTANACCNGDRAQFLANGPRIAPLWVDLNPSAAGAVYFNSLPGRAVITWDQTVEYGQGTQFTAQLQLLADGSFAMFWDPAVRIVGHTTLIGSTQGGNAADPGALDFANALPFDSGTTATIYETFVANAFDLGGIGVTFTPNGRGGYAVARRTDCRFASFVTQGAGCPTSPSVYELFANAGFDLAGTAFDFTPSAGGGYDVTRCASACLDPGYVGATSLGLGDDAVARNLALGFTFPFHGGSTTAVDVSSNGSVYLEPGTIGGHRCCDGDPGAFLSETASIAPIWMDLNPGAGGAVRTHRPSATSFAITYDAVPEYNVAGSANTAQLVMWSDGRFRIAFGAAGNVSHLCLVGFTPGNGAVDPGSIDLSTATPFSTGAGGTPLGLVAGAGTRPSLGTTFTMVIGEAPGSASAGWLLLGFASIPNGTPLAPIGMPGCRLYVVADVATPFAIQGAYSVASLAIPSTPSLAGIVVFAQAIVVAPGVNALGAVASNAGRIELGT